MELIGLETASKDSLYAWRLECAPEPFRREQTLPEAVFEDVEPVRMRAATLSMLDRLNPDAVGIMSYGYPDARAALEWCRRRRRIAIIMTDSKADDAPRVAWREAIKRLIVAQFDSALVAGSDHRDYLIQLGFPSNRVFLGYDVVDNDFFHTNAAAARKSPSQWRHLPGLEDASTAAFKPYFLASNRFIARKNLERLVLAYGQYREQARAVGIDPWRLLLLGDGPRKERLEALIIQHQIAGVTFCGFRQIEDIPIYYGLAGAFVHPAENDQWGLVINEAMASGLPIVASTGAGAARDLVQPGENGCVFDPGDERELADRLAWIASPCTDRSILGSRSYDIISNWNLDRFANGFWQAVLAGRRTAARHANPAGMLLLQGVNRLARNVRAFHSVEV